MTTPEKQAYQRQYRAKHKKILQAKNHAYYMAHKDQIIDTNHTYYVNYKHEPRVTQQEYAAEHRAEILLQKAEYRAKNRVELQQDAAIRFSDRQAWIAQFKDKPCVDCHKSFDLVCMEFDHVKGIKKGNVSRMFSQKKSLILAEIRKCEIVCANCHRIRTRNRGKPHKYSETQLAGVIDTLKQSPCTRCFEMFPPEAMDFDHIDPRSKLHNIGNFRPKSKRNLPLLMAEIAKCRLLCANCHRKHTHPTTYKKAA